MASVTIDFVGMCLVLKEGPQVSIGFIDDPGHLHLLHFHDHDGLPVVLPLTFAGSKKIVLKGVAEGETLVRTNDRLPDLRDIPDVGRVRDFDEILPELRSVLVLTGGVLEAHVPIEERATGPWTFKGREDPDRSFKLTDRLRFSTLRAAEFVTLAGEGKTFVIGNERMPEIRATISAIDHDVATRRPLHEHDPLTEFALFYRCSEHSGPVPSFAPTAPGANPGNPICPDLMIDFDLRTR